MHRSSLQKAFVHLTALGETKVVVVAIYCTGPVHKLNLPNSLLKRQKICFHFLLSFAKWCLQILDVIYYNLVNTVHTSGSGPWGQGLAPILSAFLSLPQDQSVCRCEDI